LRRLGECFYDRCGFIRVNAPLRARHVAPGGWTRFNCFLFEENRYVPHRCGGGRSNGSRPAKAQSMCIPRSAACGDAGRPALNGCAPMDD
jgi:hypothetical protein